MDKQLCAHEAKALLMTTDLTIQEISVQLNFPRQSHFGKYFKDQTKLSPKEYRNRFYPDRTCGQYTYSNQVAQSFDLLYLI